jgi:hypothetical protein
MYYNICYTYLLYLIFMYTDMHNIMYSNSDIKHSYQLAYKNPPEHLITFHKNPSLYTAILAYMASTITNPKWNLCIYL